MEVVVWGRGSLSSARPGEVESVMAGLMRYSDGVCLGVAYAHDGDDVLHCLLGGVRSFVVAGGYIVRESHDLPRLQYFHYGRM